jgi:hypothetical protein
MALERRDGRFKMDPDAYTALIAIAEAHDLDIGAYVESELLKIIRHEVHVAMVLAEKTRGLDIPGIFRESSARASDGGK